MQKQQKIVTTLVRSKKSFAMFVVTCRSAFSISALIADLVGIVRLERKNMNNEDKGECTRCWRDVPESELVTFGDWRLCEICQEDVQ